MIARIAEQGEGNPFYLEELVTYLHATGVDLRDPRAVAALELPDGLQRLLTARLDQLGEGEKATIKVASVIGRRFRASWIAQAYPGAGGPQEVARHLERLHQLDLTPRRSDAADPEYQFKHAMTQETAYQSLTFGMRESLARARRAAHRVEPIPSASASTSTCSPTTTAARNGSTSSGCGSGPQATRPGRRSPTTPPWTTTGACYRSCRRPRRARCSSSSAVSGS